MPWACCTLATWHDRPTDLPIVMGRRTWWSSTGVRFEKWSLQGPCHVHPGEFRGVYSVRVLYYTTIYYCRYVDPVQLFPLILRAPCATEAMESALARRAWQHAPRLPMPPLPTCSFSLRFLPPWGSPSTVRQGRPITTLAVGLWRTVGKRKESKVWEAYWLTGANMQI